MAHKLQVRNKLKVHVKGQLKDEDGGTVEFDFHLHCKRKSQDELNSLVNSAGTQTIRDFLKDNVEGWDEDVQDAGGSPLPFSAENFDQMLAEPGMGLVCFQSYLRDSGATVKN